MGNNQSVQSVVKSTGCLCAGKRDDDNNLSIYKNSTDSSTKRWKSRGKQYMSNK